ncbi:MAG: hypothetical protein ACLR23_00840 [Clostridia bacterium]
MVIGSIVGCLVSGISEFAAEVLLGSVYWILRSYEWLCQCILKLPFSVWRPGRPAMGKLLIYSCILAAGVVYYTKKTFHTTAIPLCDGGHCHQRNSIFKPVEK